MNYEIIRTGSDGNCLLLNYQIAVDMGVPYSAIKDRIGTLRLVLLTHRHSDHFTPGTVRRLAKQRPTLRWGCCEWMVDPLRDAGVDPRNIDVFTPGGWASYETVYISPFRLKHNIENCGWKIQWQPGPSVIYATDTSSLDGIEAKGYDLYFIEANHREDELQARKEAKLAAGEFSYEAAAAENHLSREAAVAWLAENMDQRGRWIPMHQHRERGKEG